MSLVDRAAELARIRQHLDEARRGDGGAFVAVTGEPGAGKSTLLREALAEVPAYWGYCEPGLTPRPLGPFRDVIDAGALGSGSVEADLAGALLAAMRVEPLVVVVEDAHWIDDASARALQYLGRRIADSQGVLLVSYRDNVGPAHPIRQVLGDLATAIALSRIELGGLSAAGVAELLTGSGRDPDQAYRITGGNPFLVTALRDAPGEEISATVRDLAWSWARRLDEPALSLLKDLAVVPGRIPTDELHERSADLDALLVSGLLTSSGRHLAFRHELVRRAIESELSPSERSSAHLDAYSRLRARAVAEPSELAFHALHAGLSDESLIHERRAAEQAVSSGAHTQAVAHYRRVVELAPGRLEDRELAEICMALAGEELAVGHDADARRYAAQAAALVRAEDEPVVHGRTLLTRSRVAVSDAEAIEFARRAVVVLEELGDGRDFADACGHLASRLMVARELDVAATWARRSLASIEAEDHPAIAVNALQALGSALTLTGQDDDCVHLRRAVEIGTRAGLDRELGLAHCNLISAAGEARLYRVVDEATPAALAFFAAHDLDGLAGYTSAWLGRCAFEQGRWSEATQWVDEVLADPDKAVDITMLTALCVRGRIRARRGDPGAHEPLAEAREHAVRIGSLQRLAPVAVAIAEASWLAGEKVATDDLEVALELARERSSAPYAAELSVWLRRLGVQVDLTRNPETVPGSLWSLQLAGDPEAAGDAWAAIGCPYEAAEAWSASDEEQVLRRALETIDPLGAAPLRARVVRRMRELGIRSIPRGRRTSTLADATGLTAREQEVLGWLRRGCTDAEIAAGLHLSVKTVGHHVSAILRKTGSASRRDLRAIADGS